MGFRSLLRKTDRTVFDAWKASVPDEVHANIDRDPLIPDEPDAGHPAARRDLLEILNASDQEADALTGATCRFCWSHGLEGPAHDPAPQILGHVRSLDKLADWITMNGSNTAPDELRAMLRDLCRLPAATALDEQQKQLSALLGDTPLSPYPMWSFFADDGDAEEALPDERSEAVNRLGLGHVDTMTELIVWFHRADHTPLRPTAWDGELNPYWRPGGRTEPLDGSGASNGLPEAVHPPVPAVALAAPMRRID